MLGGRHDRQERHYAVGVAVLYIGPGSQEKACEESPIRRATHIIWMHPVHPSLPHLCSHSGRHPFPLHTLGSSFCLNLRADSALIFQGPAGSLLSSCPRWWSLRAVQVTNHWQAVLSSRHMRTALLLAFYTPLHMA